MVTFEGVKPVAYVYYYDHAKRNAPGTPHTVRVEYCVDSRTGRTVNEWICPEHERGRRKFVAWWKQRSDEPAPKTVEDVVAAGNNCRLREPVEIHCTLDDEEFDRINGYRFAAQGEISHRQLDNVDYSDDDDYDDLPF